MLHTKNIFLNRQMLHGAIQKIKVAHFYGPRCILFMDREYVVHF